MSKTFSIIVPLYNCEEYIEECIYSLLKQTYKDFEIIIVNDGSTDNSLSVVERIQDNKIKIINQENKGLFHARISGLKVATGDVCLFVDADDLIDKDTLKSIHTYFSQGHDCIIYKLATFYENDNHNMVEEKAVFPDKSIFVNENKKVLLTTLLTSGKVNSIVCKAFKRGLIGIDKLSEYPRIAIGEDALFTLELFGNMNSAIYLDKPFYCYRQQSESMSHKLTANIYFDNVYRFKIYREISEKYYFGAELERIREDIDKITYKMITSMAMNKRFIVENYVTFCQIFQKVACDKNFLELYKRSYQKQNILYRYVADSIYNANLKSIYQMRQLFGIVSWIYKLVKR